MESSKRIVGVVEGVTGQTYDTHYDLFFTENSVVAAVVLHPSDLIGACETRRFEELLIGSVLRSQELRAWSRRLEEERRQSYSNKTIQEVLRTHSSSFEIPYDHIVSAKVSHTVLGSILEFVTATENGTRRRIKFRPPRDQLICVENLLGLALPDKKLSK
jgi:hypothetical protein